MGDFRIAGIVLALKLRARLKYSLKSTECFGDSTGDGKKIGWWGKYRAKGLP